MCLVLQKCRMGVTGPITHMPQKGIFGRSRVDETYSFEAR